MRRILIAAAFVLVGRLAAEAQIVVYDPAVTARNSVTATVKELLVNLQDLQRRLLRRMARRLSLFTDLSKYAIAEIPRWRIHVFLDSPEEPVFFARDYHAA